MEKHISIFLLEKFVVNFFVYRDNTYFLEYLIYYKFMFVFLGFLLNFQLHSAAVVEAYNVLPNLVSAYLFSTKL